MKTEELQFEAKTLTWDRAITESVHIKAPIEKVWDYVSDSGKAIEWSIYFHHISFLPGGSADGMVGSFRRCFRNENEKGPRWDEETINIQKQESRQIVMFNMQGYFMNFLTQGSYCFVRQIYKAQSDGTTILTFQTQISERCLPLQKFIFKHSSKKTKDIFLKNLQNIAARIEQRMNPHHRS
ncbi:MAG: SRPBCC family protein [Bacteriovoracaceae bacterium]